MKIISVADPAASAAGLRRSAATLSSSLIEEARAIMKGVLEHGDSAVIDYTAKFDGARIESLKVAKQEIDRAYDQVTKEQKKAIRTMKDRLTKSELALLRRLKGLALSFDGVRLERQAKPVASVGCYIPGGKARYPSTVVMCAVPAKVAGVRRVVAVSPPRKDGSIDPLTLVAADICGIDEFYKVGGAQGIAALAYGTQSIKPVSKLVGPGGMFVAAAKLVASSRVSTDMVAGPTELLIYADSTADARLVAADLISQAEHSADTICGLVTASEELASRVRSQVESSAEKIARADIVQESLRQNGFIAVCGDEASCAAFVNEFAPEHLEVMGKTAERFARKVDAAGVVLIGDNVPSSASDYCFGSNHVLPTLGFGKSRASLSVLDFVKIVSTVRATKTGLRKIDRHVREMASAEGLLNHYEAVKARMDRTE